MVLRRDSHLSSVSVGSRSFSDATDELSLPTSLTRDKNDDDELMVAADGTCGICSIAEGRVVAVAVLAELFVFVVTSVAVEGTERNC